MTSPSTPSQDSGEARIDGRSIREWKALYETMAFYGSVPPSSLARSIPAFIAALSRLQAECEGLRGDMEGLHDGLNSAEARVAELEKGLRSVRACDELEIEWAYAVLAKPEFSERMGTGALATILAGLALLRTASHLLAKANEGEGSVRDWPEDSSHENGNYHNLCVVCGSSFIGHKRRVICKVCAPPPAPLPPAEAEPVARSPFKRFVLDGRAIFKDGWPVCRIVTHGQPDFPRIEASELDAFMTEIINRLNAPPPPLETPDQRQASIVKWLRERAKATEDAGRSMALYHAADQIESGVAHLEQAHDQG